MLMSIRTVIYIPDPRLRAMSKPIDVFDDDLQQLIDDMFETMYSVRGVGLAAPQIGINIRLSVVDCTSDKSQQLVLINPEIIESSEELCSYQEGCLSVPGVYAQVKRAKSVRLRAQDRHGKIYEIDAEDLLAECFQHEIDHLNGKVFIDYLSPIKRQLARRKVEKIVREQSKFS
jgi:peptide deformylase